MVPARLRPRRSLVVPVLALSSPVAWFLLRESGRGGSLGPPRPALAVLTVAVALAASYVVAAVGVSPLRAWTADHPLTRAVFDPDDATLAALGAVLAAVVGYVALSTVGSVPGAVEVVARPVGFVLAVPLALLYGGLAVLAGVTGGGDPVAWVQWTVVGAGVALSVVWTTLLLAAATEAVERIATGGSGTKD